MSLTARDFPPGTPLYHFFAWNEGMPLWRRDRRYKLARNPEFLPKPVAQALQAAIGSIDLAAHAEVFAAFERAARRVGESRRRILVIRLSALGDFIQALGPIAAIRRHHAGDHVSLLTTRPLAGFAEELGYFDEVIVDERPGVLALPGWLRLRRRLRRGRFDRVYDLQTSTRSAAYAWLLRPGLPEWSGVAWHCSHPHANRDRDPQHTLDKQAEQLLMAGIHPTPLPTLPPLRRTLPCDLQDRDFVLLVPGSSPTHPEKRWPAERFGALALALDKAGCRAVIVGTAPEAPLAARIREICPAALDLTGQTDLGLLGALAQRAALTVGNDTGVCHPAAAAGCAVVVLFSGGTDPARCAPRGEFVEVIAADDLRDLAPQPVIAASLTILGGGGGRFRLERH
jgi:ADP-heptose:LPS heptosyltransferase